MPEIVIRGGDKFKYNGVDANIVGKRLKDKKWMIVQFRFGQRRTYFMTSEEVADAMRDSEAQRLADNAADSLANGIGQSDTTRRVVRPKPSLGCDAKTPRVSKIKQV